MRASSSNPGAGYPQRYYEDRRRCRWCAVPSVAFFRFITLAFGYVLWVGVKGPGVILGLCLAAVLFLFCLEEGIRDCAAARIIPYFEQPLPEAETFLSGQALARNCLHLDRLAAERGLRSISGFGFNDALRGEPVVWHDAADGLQTIDGLLEAVTDQPQAVRNSRAVVSNLEKIRNALSHAERKGIRFAFLLEQGSWTTARVWAARKGHA